MQTFLIIPVLSLLGMTAAVPITDVPTLAEPTIGSCVTYAGLGLLPENIPSQLANTCAPDPFISGTRMADLLDNSPNNGTSIISHGTYHSTLDEID